MKILLNHKQQEIEITQDFKSDIHNLYNTPGTNTMLLFPYYIYNKLDNTVKSQVCSPEKEYTSLEMINLNVLTVLTDDDFDIDEYKKMVTIFASHHSININFIEVKEI